MEPRPEAIALVRELLSLEATADREAEICDRLDAICPDPEWSGNVFQSDVYLGADGEFDYKRWADRVFEYKAIAL